MAEEWWKDEALFQKAWEADPNGRAWHLEQAKKLAPYDHTFQVTAWKVSWREPYWFLDIRRPDWCDTKVGPWCTQTPWLRLAEYMAKDWLVCALDLDYKHWDQITVSVTRGIGPSEGWHDSWLRSAYSWLWAQYAGVKDSISFWRIRRDVRRRNR